MLESASLPPSAAAGGKLPAGAEPLTSPRSFASGKGSALVLDVGDELASVVPIYDGFVLRKGPSWHSRQCRSKWRAASQADPSDPCLVRAAIQKQPAAGRLMSQMILRALKTQDRPVEIVPQYLVKSKEPVEPDAPAKAVLRSVACA